MIDRYAGNVEYMVRESLAREIPVMLLSVPVNLKDWVPNASVHGAGLCYRPPTPQAMQRPAASRLGQEQVLGLKVS